MKKGFTLIELLIVIGIIAILSGVSLMSFSKMMKTADKRKAQELLGNVVTALTAIYETDGMWPKKIRESVQGEGLLDKDVALVIAKRGMMSMSLSKDKTRLTGNDRFGILTPWAAKVVERRGEAATEETIVIGDQKVRDHILRFAVDLDGDGEITSDECSARTGAEVIRATVVVWCCGKDGKRIESWTKGQSQKVK